MRRPSPRWPASSQRAGAGSDRADPGAGEMESAGGRHAAELAAREQELTTDRDRQPVNSSALRRQQEQERLLLTSPDRLRPRNRARSRATTSRRWPGWLPSGRFRRSRRVLPARGAEAPVHRVLPDRLPEELIRHGRAAPRPTRRLCWRPPPDRSRWRSGPPRQSWSRPAGPGRLGAYRDAMASDPRCARATRAWKLWCAAGGGAGAGALGRREWGPWCARATCSFEEAAFANPCSATSRPCPCCWRTRLVPACHREYPGCRHARWPPANRSAS
jgi:hypothetical protein